MDIDALTDLHIPEMAEFFTVRVVTRQRAIFGLEVTDEAHRMLTTLVKTYFHVMTGLVLLPDLRVPAMKHFFIKNRHGDMLVHEWYSKYCQGPEV